MPKGKYYRRNTEDLIDIIVFLIVFIAVVRVVGFYV